MRMPFSKTLAVVFIAAAHLALASVAAAQLVAPGPAAAGAPAVVFPVKTHEFAPVIDGAHVTHDFTVANKGTTPLLIDNVRTG
jgi:hypothetical protein